MLLRRLLPLSTVVIMLSFTVIVLTNRVQAASLTVNVTSDGNDGACTVDNCSLREAIIAANQLPDTDTIAFSISGAGLHTIQPTSALPTITSPVIIDGTSQTGYAVGAPVIEFDGTNAGFPVNGLYITGGNSTVKGLIINRFTFAGIALQTNGGNLIKGNFIGTDSTGTLARGNRDGVYVFDSAGNTIGGFTAADRNLISGNTDDGVNFEGIGATGNKVQGNYIGTTITGTVGLANAGDGVKISNTSGNNLIGGDTAQFGNVIAFNNGRGIFGELDVTAATGNRFSSNSIFSNVGLGIDLNGDGATANDTGDADTGANNLQNYPIAMSITPLPTRTPISGTFNSIPNKSFRLEFFFNDTCAVISDSEGKTYLGNTFVTTNASGNATFNITLPVSVTPVKFVTATATDPNNNTSEFSECALIFNAPSPLGTVQTGPIYTVNTTADIDEGVCTDVSCSLREAIYEANENSDTNTIAFHIAGAGAQTIRLASELPVITSPVIIDGTTQTSFVGVPLIELDGTNAGSSARGLTLAGGSSTIKGLIVNRFGLSGIWLAVGGDYTVIGNYLGTDSTGTQPRGNRDGITTTGSANNRIGGLSVAERNIISGNMDDGINLYDSTTTGTLIEGNYIGVDVTGQAALGNGESGIEFSNIANATVGGTTSAARNIISGNQYGIYFSDGGTSTLIEGNYIGTNADGTTAIPNQAGIWILNGDNNQIGGATPAARNVISGNATGIKLSGYNNRIQGNYIGVAPDGSTPLGNIGVGIDIDTFSMGILPSTIIGGATAGMGNLIAYNGTFGITTNTGALSVKSFAILGNSIFSNGNLGIDLGGDGISLNDVGDADIGPNGRQNFPLLSSGQNANGTITVNGTLNSKSNATYRLEFFANPSCDSSGYGEGQTYLGFTNVTTNGSGDASFAANMTAVVLSGQFITATATDPSNNTSEFSACAPVIAVSLPAAAPTPNYYRTTSVPLTWTGVTWATGYEIQVDDNADFMTLAYSSSLGADARSNIANLPPVDAVYYWRVGAKKVGGGIVWSASQKFTVDVP